MLPAPRTHFTHQISSPRDSGPFKVKSRAPLQAHPTENTDPRTKTARPQETHVLEMPFLSCSKSTPLRSTPLLQSQLFQASGSAGEQGGSWPLTPLITNRG